MHVFNAPKCLTQKLTSKIFKNIHVCISHSPTFYVHHSSDYLEKKEAKLPKTDLRGPYPKAYEPKNVEEGWYRYWEQNNLFNDKFLSEESQDSKPIFSLVLPPPNVTGKLHIGHTLTATVQDCICRWRRMKGEKVYWIPGYDHGGIATQTVVEKNLHRKKKLMKHEKVGKEDFFKEIHEWKSLTQKNIEAQLKRLGSSLDFSQASFTMDENASKAVTKVFVQLFDEGLIYRKEKLVNWSCKIKSVISDIEVDHVEIPVGKTMRVPGLQDPIELGMLDYFYYPVVDSDEKLLIATSRLETMLADSAIAVNPDDNRYSHLIGRYVRHPYTAEHLPIIADQDINKEFGSGIMKVTPAHDFKDYELGERHKLKFKDVLSDDGMINMDVENENFMGKHRLIVRQLLRKSLAEKGLFKESKSHSMSIPLCSRTGDIVEPRLKDQWYLNCADMGRKAVEAVKTGKLRFYPQYKEKEWFEWFRHSKDWCISRQIWWGHKIPAFKVYDSSNSEKNFHWVAAASEEEALEKAVEKYKMNPKYIQIIQDSDVLDTWFSSALYPLTSLEWPTKMDKMEKLYPLSLMETGHDILFFWVARMVMLGEHITGQLPFQEVLLHGMVSDSHGKKMTKSLGNTVDPLDIIEGITIEDLLKRAKESEDNLTPEEYKSVESGYRHNFPKGILECGTDGLRFSLLSHDIQKKKINIDVKDIYICRHFCNKIWQGVRLFTQAIEPCNMQDLTPLTSEEVLNMPMNDVDRWILSRLAGLVAVSNKNFEAYEFHIICSSLRQFWVQNFCDVYLEYVKNVLSSDEDQRLFLCRVMLTCIQVFLRVISPLMPYLSEELYQRLSFFANIPSYSSISVAPYPVANDFLGWRITVLEADMHTVTDLIGIARSLKAKHGVTKLKPAVTIAVEEENTLSALNPFSNLIASLAKLESVTFHLTQGQEFFEHHPQDTWVFQVHDHGITVIMDIGVSICADNALR